MSPFTAEFENQTGRDETKQRQECGEGVGNHRRSVDRAPRTLPATPAAVIVATFG
jgi:hypothetical protein